MFYFPQNPFTSSTSQHHLLYTSHCTTLQIHYLTGSQESQNLHLLLLVCAFSQLNLSSPNKCCFTATSATSSQKSTPAPLLQSYISQMLATKPIPRICQRRLLGERTISLHALATRSTANHPLYPRKPLNTKNFCSNLEVDEWRMALPLKNCLAWCGFILTGILLNYSPDFITGFYLTECSTASSLRDLYFPLLNNFDSCFLPGMCVTFQACSSSRLRFT
jgi:hypothetical protein